MKRRAGVRSVRGRRKTARRTRRTGPRIPVPAIAIIAIIAVLALIAYVVWQQRGDSKPEYEEEARLETDQAPDLPGEWVDLPAIYGGTYPDTARYVRSDVDYGDQGLPPAGGPFWGDAPCPEEPDEAPRFCGPAPWRIYREPWEPEVLVHNLLRGGVVLWYNTTDQAIIDELEELVLARLQDGYRLVMTPYDGIDEEHFALTAWARRELFAVGDYKADDVEAFIDAFEGRFNP
jgi:hypothetical protein